MADTLMDKVYRLARDKFGREPDANTNKYNYVKLAEQGKSLSEIEKLMSQEEKESITSQKQFLGSLGFNKTTTDLTEARVLDEVTDMVADLVDSYVDEEEAALADIGIFEVDEGQLRQEILKDPNIVQYMDEQYTVLNRQISEGRIANEEQFQQSLQSIANNATDRLASISITEAQTDEELRQKLLDIGASTDYSVKDARRAWDERLESEIETESSKGKSFSGAMKQNMANLQTAKSEELTEIIRRGAMQGQTAETTAKYTKERAKAEREAIQRDTALAGSQVRSSYETGVRQYGTEGVKPKVEASNKITQMLQPYIQNSAYNKPAEGYVSSEGNTALKRMREDLVAQRVGERISEERQLWQDAVTEATRKKQGRLTT